MEVLKHQPKDFVVKEQITLSLKDHGPYAYLELTKTDYPMNKVVAILARSLDVLPKHIGFAGTKDKKAVTTQMISVRGKTAALHASLRQFRHPNMSITLKGWGSQPISLGDHEGNGFEITVRNIDSLPPPRMWFVNYFDEQRFQKNNIQLGKLLVKRQFGEACALCREQEAQEHLKNHPDDPIGALRKVPFKSLLMYVHAYQSFLWNTAVARCISERRGKRVIKQDYSAGILVFPADDEPIDAEIPIVGFGTDPGCGAIRDILAEESLSPRDFIIREIPTISGEGAEREMMIKVAMSWGKLQDDEVFNGKKKCIARFFLPKGAYATMALHQAFLS
ncbi:tRNA pseudouridine(13) synthase TruD [Candidatus Woesearchaeota archaeon]|nr:tRNA pseudouridine(13) synthase TruD [Candidatus Woesearchaeota archaeon]